MMDTSETYIKMCEKAEEIQKLLAEHEGHLTPPDDGIYYRNDPYPVAVVYDHRPQCPTVGIVLLQNTVLQMEES